MLTKSEVETNLEKAASMGENKIRIQSDLDNLGNGLKKQDEFCLQKHQEVKTSQGGE